MSVRFRSGLWISCVMFLVGLAVVASVVASEQDSLLSEKVSEEQLRMLQPHLPWDNQEPVWPGAVADGLTQLFRVPIHTEETSASMDMDTARSSFFTYTVSSGETFREALDRLARQGHGVSWHLVDGSIIVSHGVDEKAENLLDRPVTVDLRDLSIWEAVKAIGELIADESDERELLIIPPGVSHGRNPPRGMVEELVVNLKRNEVSARDALSAVLAQASTVIRYHYWHSEAAGSQAIIYLYVYPDERTEEAWQVTRSSMGPEELQHWASEVRMSPR